VFRTVSNLKGGSSSMSKTLEILNPRRKLYAAVPGAILETEESGGPAEELNRSGTRLVKYIFKKTLSIAELAPPANPCSRSGLRRAAPARLTLFMQFMPIRMQILSAP
jgi:hypothetical protein